MKFSLIAALIVALAIGSQAASLVKRQTDGETIGRYYQDLTQRLKDLESPEMINKAREFMAQGRPDLFIQMLEEQLRPLSRRIEEETSSSYSHPFFSWWK